MGTSEHPTILRIQSKATQLEIFTLALTLKGEGISELRKSEKESH